MDVRFAGSGPDKDMNSKRRDLLPLTKQNTAVIVLAGSVRDDFRAALEKEGFGTIAVRSARTPRAAITDALASGAGAVVTVDPSQGFTAADVERVFEQLQAHPDELCAGDTKKPDTPTAAQKLYSFLSGVEPEAGFTSLYAMSAKTAKIMTDMKSAEDTFVFNIPLQARISGIGMAHEETDVAVPPPDLKALLTKSFKLYYVFIKFSIAAMIAYIVDIGTFGLFEVVFGYLSDEYKILVATILSRVLCSIATYILNRVAVFRSESRQKSSVPRFLVLSVAQLVASWLLVWGLGVLFNANDFGNMLLKVIVDLVIFMASFTIMRDWVFEKSND